MLIIFNLVLSFVLSNVSVGGHVGGLVGGIVGGLAVATGERRGRRWIGWAGIAGVAIVSVIGAEIGRRAAAATPASASEQGSLLRRQPDDQVANGGWPGQERVVAGVDLDDACCSAGELALPAAGVPRSRAQTR